MNTEKILAELSEWAGGEFVRKDKWGAYDGRSPLSYCLNEAGELVSLRVYNAPITDLTPLSQLSSLLHLDCSSTSISDLGPLSQLASLKYLDCSETEIIDLSPVSHLMSLQYLKCSHMDLFDLSPLSQSISLQYFNCVDTDVSDLSPLSYLKSLTQLECSETPVNDLSPLSELTSLRELAFYNTEVSDLSPLSKLSSLLHVNLGGTKVVELSPLNQLKSLERLLFWRTKVSDLHSLHNFEQLKETLFQESNVSDLSPLIDLKCLKLVWANDCKIVNLPRGRIGLMLPFNLKGNQYEPGIYIRGNPLENPPIEVISRGNEAVESYFDSLIGESTKLNEVKVILVGEGGAGKTSVVNRLIHNTFDKDECMTDGIKITPWQIDTGDETIKANVWDFGGQEIMRATHQLFLSKRCIYLLVLDGRKDERPEHWLKQILSVTSEAKILVVCNKIDENPDNNLQRQHLKEKYPQIVGFFPLSCQSADGINPLKTTLNDLIVDLPMRRIELAANWALVKQQLESWSEAEDFISHDKFVELCEEQGVESDITQGVLLDLLHDLGLVIHFKALKHLQTQVLNPKWITEGIYALITSEELTKQGGLLTEDEAEKILNAKVEHFYYQNKVHFLMRVMEQFELCYAIGEGQQNYLVPSLLPVELDEQPEDLDGEAISFIYKYEGFMPPQAMPRFIVKSHKDIADGQSWRTGVVLENQAFASRARVVADMEEGEISITVVGEQRRDFFAVIRDYFAKIHQSYDQANLGLKSLVVLEHDEKVSRVDYQRLIKLEQRFLKGQHDGNDYDENLNIDFSVVDVLNGLGSSESRQIEREYLGMNLNDKHGKGPTINFNPNINVNPTMNQTQSNDQQNDQQQAVSQDVSISVEIKSLSGKLENWAEDLLDDLPEQNPQIEREVGKVQKALDEIKSVEAQTEAEEKIGKFERVSGFIADAINGENKTGEFLKAAGAGVKKLQDIGKQYNKVAAHFGLPVVPEALL